jgi:cobalt-zinc-cadmium resistance protein CzcA
MLQAADEGLPLRESVMRGCEIRFRPIIVSAIVAVIGFLPAALSHGIGAEIQRPLARVVIGGLISSTPLTLLVLPAVYELFSRGGERSIEKSNENA